MFITGVNTTGDKLFSGLTTPAKNLSPVSLTPAINPSHGFSVIAGVLVLVTSNKVITGVFVTGYNCSPVSLSPAINLSPVLLTPVTNYHW
jgi:hypothetical protein